MTSDEKTLLMAVLLQGLDECLQPAERRATPASEPAVPSGFSFAAWQDDFARCVDAQLLQNLILHYRKSAVPSSTAPESAHVRALLELMRAADRLASPKRSGDTAHPSSRTPGLAPVFDCIELINSHTPAPRHYPAKPLRATDTTEPPPFFDLEAESAKPAEVANHQQAFRQRLDELRHYINWDNFDCVYTHLFSLVQTYGWCIPAGAQTNAPEISLYDRLRSTTAIAACLYKFHAANDTLAESAIAAPNPPRCVLLTGGVSGIQDYIFGISTVGAGGVAKRLRARSFYIQLLSEAASLQVIREFDLPLTNLLMASGGKFYILLPMLPDTGDRLKRLQQAFDESLLNDFHGEVAINLAWQGMDDGGFAAGEFSRVLARLHEQLRRRKAQRLAGALQSEGLWRSADIFVRQPFDGESVCASCGRFAATEHSEDGESSGPDICAQCFKQLHLGRELTRAQFISFFTGNEGRIPCLGLSATVDKRPHQGAFLLVRLNDPALSRAGQFPVMFRYLANYIPRHDDGNPKSFSDIAGDGLLGILKADVDYLGQVFQEGLRRDGTGEGLDTLPRVAALSRELDWFFSGWLEWLLSTKYTDCYTVYSGGDDLLIVGPRKTTMSLASEIYEAFKCYTRHPEINLSAGIAVVKPRLPLAHTVKLADVALDKAKHMGRNRLCILGEVLEWQEVAPLVGEVKALGSYKPKSSFLYHLLRCGELWQSYDRDRQLLGLRYHPMLAYQIARNVSAKNESGLYKWATQLLEIPPGNSTRRVLKHLRLITQWVLLNRREKEE
ncbi:MAG TPA: type III-A CRISPR-associated protein Cas10/Csm1 [Blastocatellia bacterium]|nr:type III-A CRISPR-associated protein Cas10/Csm1 [Blastocatellia bacterium]